MYNLVNSFKFICLLTIPLAFDHRLVICLALFFLFFFSLRAKFSLGQIIVFIFLVTRYVHYKLNLLTLVLQNLVNIGVAGVGGVGEEKSRAT